MKTICMTMMNTKVLHAEGCTMLLTRHICKSKKLDTIEKPVYG